MDVQELIDRLVVSTEEQDLLFVLYWLRELRDAGHLEQAIDRTHSWKNYSALSSLVRAEWTPLRKIILELLLLSGADRSNEIIEIAADSRNMDALRILLNWSSGESEKATDARILLSLEVEQAADRIDRQFPLPPHYENLTGTNPLPARPTHLPSPPPELERTAQESPEAVRSKPPSSVDPTSVRPSASSTLDTPISYPSSRASEAPRRPSAVPSAPTSIPRTSPSRFSDQAASEAPSTAAFDRRTKVRLNLANLPLFFKRAEVGRLFTDLGIACRVILNRTECSPTYAFVDVAPDDVRRSTESLHRTSVAGRRISCIVATSRISSQQQQRLEADASTFLPDPPTHSRYISPPPCRRRRRSRSPPRSRSTSTAPSPTRRDLKSPFPSSSTNSSLRSSSQNLAEETLLFFDLPPLDHPHLEKITKNLRRFEFYRPEEEEESDTVLIVYANARSVADRLAELWDGYLIDGRRLRLVRLPRGVSPKETIEQFYRRRSRWD